MAIERATLTTIGTRSTRTLDLRNCNSRRDLLAVRLARAFAQLVFLALTFAFHTACGGLNGLLCFGWLKPRNNLTCEPHSVAFLDQSKVSLGCGAHEAHRKATLACSTRATNPVNVVD